MRGIKATGSGTSATSGVTTTNVTSAAAPVSVYRTAPQGIYDPETRRTYVAFLGLERDCYVTFHDGMTGTVATPVKVGTYPLADSDNHGPPTIALDADGHLHVVWGSHNTVQKHSKSAAPHDISTWATQNLAVGTYSTLTVDPATGDLYVLFRAGSGHGSSFPAHEFGAMQVSSDGGSTWSAAAAIVDTAGTPESSSDFYPAGSEWGDDGRLHFTWTVARGAAHDGNRINLYHAAYDPTDGHFYAADGTGLGTTIDWVAHGDALAATGADIPTQQQTLDGDRVILTYKVQVGGIWYVHVAVWDGTSWIATDTGVEQASYGTYQMTYVTTDGMLRGLFPVPGTLADLVLYGSEDGVDWWKIGTVAAGSTGEGYDRVGPVQGRGAPAALAIQAATGYANTSATAADLLPLVLVADDQALTHVHTGFADVAHDHPGLAVDTDTVLRNAGRWEVWVDDSTPPAPLISPDGTDWVYVWVEG